MEQNLLDAQRTLIEKETEVAKLVSVHKEKLYKNGADYGLTLLLQTLDSLSKESVGLKEQVWIV
jgi:hypothetical protein